MAKFHKKSQINCFQLIFPELEFQRIRSHEVEDMKEAFEKKNMKWTHALVREDVEQTSLTQ